MKDLDVLESILNEATTGVWMAFSNNSVANLTPDLTLGELFSVDSIANDDALLTQYPGRLINGQASGVIADSIRLWADAKFIAVFNPQRCRDLINEIRRLSTKCGEDVN